MKRDSDVYPYQLLHVLQTFSPGWCFVVIVETNVSKTSCQLCFLACEC